MSPDEQNIVGFVKLIESQPFLFSSSDQTSLKELVATLPNDTEQISNAIGRRASKKQQQLEEDKRKQQEKLEKERDTAKAVSFAIATSQLPNYSICSRCGFVGGRNYHFCFGPSYGQKPASNSLFSYSISLSSSFHSLGFRQHYFWISCSIDNWVCHLILAKT